MLDSVPRVLSIAGSDPSGGAGIQADLKTFAALGAYGMAAITALTAQNTTGVRGVHAVPTRFLREQIDAVFDDIQVNAVKIGMVGSAEAVAVVADCLEHHAPREIVVDPVMVAKSGDRLVDDAAVAALAERLLPLATVVTPNLAETAVLLDQEAAPEDASAMVAAGWRLCERGSRSVLIKGGHLGGERAPDVLCGPEGEYWFDAPRVPTANTHGTGCTLSSAIAALLPRADSAGSAVAGAKRYLTAAIERADDLALGQGTGPVHHFASAWRDDPAAAWLAAGTAWTPDAG